MYPLVKPFIDICLLRLAPQALPYSGTLLMVALAAYTLTGVLAALSILPMGEALMAGIASTGLLSVLTVTLLYARSLQGRINQTLTALAGTGALLDTIGVPLNHWFQAAKSSGGDPTLPTLLILVLVGWSLAVSAHVLRHALSTLFFFGLMLALVFFWVSLNVIYEFFPANA